MRKILLSCAFICKPITTICFG